MLKGVGIYIGAMSIDRVDYPGMYLRGYDFFLFLLVIVCPATHHRVGNAHTIGKACIAFQFANDALGHRRRRIAEEQQDGKKSKKGGTEHRERTW